MKLTTIPVGAPFLNFLAEWIVARHGGDPLTLARALVLLPSRRACRGLREAFLQATSGRPTLLPRIQPIGEMEVGMAGAEDIPPPISPLRRQLLLTRLILATHPHYPVDQAADLAKSLAEFIDEVDREKLDFIRLSTLVPEEQDLPKHWEQVLSFLQLVSHHWPRILEAEAALDPIDHRNRLLAATVKAWRDNPPDHPIIAAGSTGSTPATAELLAAITHLPQGMVILPGLDKDMPDSEWEILGETHPQFGLKKLLEKMNCKRDAVITFHSLPNPPPQGRREIILRILLQPPTVTSGWRQASLPLKEGLYGLRLLTADTLADEARMIAVILREALETLGKTAALVTPDRQLARRVAAQMGRFGVAIDDSAGKPLMATPPAVFLRLILDLASSLAAPVPLLAVLRHPLAAVGLAPAECRRLSRELEIRALRGIRPMPGLEALLEAAAKVSPPAYVLLSAFAERARPLVELFQKETPVSLSVLLSAHIACAEALASTDQESGADRLWAGEDGNQLAAYLAEVSTQAELLPTIDPLTYPSLFDTLLSDQTFRPSYGLHPRLHILSPLEARLQQFDLMILGSLNEGSWPAAPAADPWMSRPMRKAFGLPPPECAIGQSAHDVAMLAAAPEVILSRARKVDGAPTVPSRWLVRLETLVKGLDPELFASLRIEPRYEHAMHTLDAPLPLPPLSRPMPTPPIEARPRRLPVTAIDTWLTDPYAIYARYILGLRQLPPLDEEPDAADFGERVHKAMERFVSAWPNSLPDESYEKLLACGQEAFREFPDRPGIALLWWPRFEAMAEWLIEQERERRGGIAEVVAELKSEWQIGIDGKPFTLTGRIDRLELAPDGGATLIDYKTGYVPPPKDIKSGHANQLPLMALMTPNKVAAMQYWKLRSRQGECEIISLSPDMIAPAQQRLEDLIRYYDQSSTPYEAASDPSIAKRPSDFAHLTRRQEWEAV